MTEHIRGLEPTGWEDRSAYRFLAPEQKQMVGFLMTAQLVNVRSQITITWELVEQDALLVDLVADRPLPFTVTPLHVGQVEGSPPQVRRVFRFADPLSGWLIQQSQTLIKEGNRLYTVLMTSDPLDVSVAEKAANQSSRVVQLMQDTQCQ